MSARAIESYAGTSIQPPLQPPDEPDAIEPRPMTRAEEIEAAYREGLDTGFNCGWWAQTQRILQDAKDMSKRRKESTDGEWECSETKKRMEQDPVVTFINPKTREKILVVTR